MILTMKQTIKTLSGILILALAAGCASTQSKEDALVASGFRIITPTTPVQEAKLKALPTNKVTMVQNAGKTYYVFPDAAKNQAYIGGATQLQDYKALRAQQNISNENLETAEMNQDTSMGWGGWVGWGGMRLR